MQGQRVRVVAHPLRSPERSAEGTIGKSEAGQRKRFCRSAMNCWSAESGKTLAAFEFAYRIKRYDEGDFSVFYRWLNDYVDGWGSCDDLCTHAFGWYVYQHPSCLDQIAGWTESSNYWVRRAAAVVSGKDPLAVLGHLKALIKSVDAAIMARHRDEGRGGPGTLSDENARGFYEELRSTYNRLRDACDRMDQAKAFLSVNAAVREVRDLFGSSYDSHGLPDLHTPLSERDYELIRQRAAAHEAMVKSLLTEHGVSINEFADVGEFCSSPGVKHTQSC